MIDAGIKKLDEIFPCSFINLKKSASGKLLLV